MALQLYELKRTGKRGGRVGGEAEFPGKKKKTNIEFYVGSAHDHELLRSAWRLLQSSIGGTLDTSVG